MLVAEGSEGVDGRWQGLRVRDDDVDVEDGLSGKARYGRAADVFDRSSDVGDGWPEAGVEHGELTGPLWVVGLQPDGHR